MVGGFSPAGITLLERVDWATIGEQVRHEQRNRECYTPAISVFRWWARRPHAVVGALLDAANTTGVNLTVSDPFSGGGTVAIEAARRGLPVVAQDLHPWPITGLETVFDGVAESDVTTAAEKILADLEELRRDLYSVPCPKHGDRSEVVHAFWVTNVDCPNCTSAVFLYPYSLVSLASRHRDEGIAYFGCSACGAVTRSSLGTRERRCRSCHRRLAATTEALTPGRVATCRRCHTEFAIAADGRRWKLALVQRLCADGDLLHFDYPTDADARHASPIAGEVPAPLLEEIPDGLETRVLRRFGFSRWSDLYPPRQLQVLLRAADATHAANLPSAITQRLLVAIVGAAEMAGYLSRWDRYYPKAFEAIANHRFSSVGLSVETNLLAHRGRGTLRRRFRASAKAARWAREHVPAHARHARIRARRLSDDTVVTGTILARRSSERQVAPSDGISLVLTDPPYFDDVQYGELASLFLAWARGVGLLPASVEVDLRKEVVPNAARGTSGGDYVRLLKNILTETRRTMRSDGVLVLTFHNTDLEAWAGLARALAGSGFHIAALAVVHSENERDHAKRHGRGFTKDLVIECRANGTPPNSPRVAWCGDDGEARELVAAGLALAKSGAGGSSNFASILEANCADIKEADRRIRGRRAKRAS